MRLMLKKSSIYVSCQSGTRAYIALRILQGNGYSNVSNLSGGYETYSIATKKFEISKNKYVLWIKNYGGYMLEEKLKIFQNYLKFYKRK